MHVAGSDGLPLTTVDGVTVLTGRYPDRDQLRQFAGLVDAAPEDAAPTALRSLDARQRHRNLLRTRSSNGSTGGCC